MIVMGTIISPEKNNGMKKQSRRQDTSEKNRVRLCVITRDKFKSLIPHRYILEYVLHMYKSEKQLSPCWSLHDKYGLNNIVSEDCVYK